MIKQVVVLRTDLNMRKGKMVAQGSHASSKVFFDRLEKCPDKENTYTMTLTNEMVEWLEALYTKITVGVSSEEELLLLYEEAKLRDLPVSLITDMGKTEFHGVPTITALAIGPALAETIDTLTGHLKLL